MASSALVCSLLDACVCRPFLPGNLSAHSAFKWCCQNVLRGGRGGRSCHKSKGPTLGLEFCFFVCLQWRLNLVIFKKNCVNTHSLWAWRRLLMTAGCVKINVPRVPLVLVKSKTPLSPHPYLCSALLPRPAHACLPAIRPSKEEYFSLCLRHLNLGWITFFNGIRWLLFIFLLFYKCLYSVSLPSVYNHLQSQNSMKSVFFFGASEALSILRFCLVGSPWRLHHTSPPLVLWEGSSSYSLKTSEQGAWGRGEEENHRCPASLGVGPCYKLSRIRFPSMSNLIFLESSSGSQHPLLPRPQSTHTRNVHLRMPPVPGHRLRLLRLGIPRIINHCKPPHPVLIRQCLELANIINI